MDDPVAVALKGRAELGQPFGPEAATAGLGLAGEGVQHCGLPCSERSCVIYVDTTPKDTGTAMELTLPPKVTDRAFARLAEIASLTGDARPLRVAVDGGGCSGFQYSITLSEAGLDDLVLEKDGQRVLVDQVSLPFLSNAVIDFTDELIGARFVVQNPNAKTSCGCGTSFSV